MAEKKIGAKTFRVEKMLAFDALVMQARIGKTIGPAMTKLAGLLTQIREEMKPDDTPALPGIGTGIKTVSQTTGAAAAAAIFDIFQANEPRAVAGLIKDIAQLAEIQTDSGQYVDVDLDRDFSDDMASLPELIGFVLSEQFSDFFSAVLAGGNRLITRRP